MHDDPQGAEKWMRSLPLSPADFKREEEAIRSSLPELVIPKVDEK